MSSFITESRDPSEKSLPHIRSRSTYQPYVVDFRRDPFQRTRHRMNKSYQDITKTTYKIQTPLLDNTPYRSERCDQIEQLFEVKKSLSRVGVRLDPQKLETALLNPRDLPQNLSFDLKSIFSTRGNLLANPIKLKPISLKKGKKKKGKKGKKRR